MWHHVHGFFFDIGEHFVGNALHTALGVTAGGGGVAVHGTEVTLTFDEGHTHGKGLGEAHQGIIDG